MGPGQPRHLQHFLDGGAHLFILLPHTGPPVLQRTGKLFRHIHDDGNNHRVEYQHQREIDQRDNRDKQQVLAQVQHFHEPVIYQHLDILYVRN